MVQAARSGVQNIAEGSEVSATSKKMELKLTQVARASLEELCLDYEDFLRHRSLPLWPESDARRAALVARRCSTADAVAEWIKEMHGRDGLYGQNGQPEPNHGQPEPNDALSIRSIPSSRSISPKRSTYSELAANAALVLIGVACALLDRQISSQAAAFENEGGFTERLYRIRSQRRQNPPRPSGP